MNNISVNELMTCYGFQLEEGHFIDQNLQNKKHFQQVIEQLAERNITLNHHMEEGAFISILEKPFESTGEMLYPFEHLALHRFDIYVRGLVMQLNRLGCRTTGSCDGHDQRRAHIYFDTVGAVKKAAFLLEHVGLVVA